MLSDTRVAHYNFFNTPWLFLNLKKLQPCGIFNMVKDPTLCAFNEIPLKGNDAIIFYNGDLYYANLKEETVRKIRNPSVTQKPVVEASKSLKEKASDDYKLLNRKLSHSARVLMKVDPLAIENIPLSKGELIDAMDKLFCTPFASFGEFALQCQDLVITPLILLLRSIVAIAVTAVVTAVMPPVIAWNLCTKSFNEAEFNVRGLVDLYIGLGDFLLRTALSIPMELGSLLARSVVTIGSSVLTPKNHQPIPDQEQDQKHEHEHEFELEQDHEHAITFN